MNTNTPNRQSVRGRWASGMVAALAGCALLLPGAAYAQQRSPVGSWDCLISGGGQQGIAFLTFVDNGTNRTFSGYQLEVSKVSNGSELPSPNDRSNGARGDMVETNTAAGDTNVFGFSPISGPWNYDEKGRVIGYFTQKINAVGVVTNFQQMTVYDYTNVEYTVTNLLDVVSTNTINLGVITFSTPMFATNFVWQDINYATNYTYNLSVILVNTNYAIDTTGGEFTNSISFVGTVTPGTRITLTSQTSFGKITYRGVPMRPNLMDLTGDWYGEKKLNNKGTIEFFHLTSVATYNPWKSYVGFEHLGDYPSIYFTTNGTGPGYEFEGFAVLSSKKKIGFTFQTYPLDDREGALRATYGSISSSRKADTKGIEEPGSSIRLKAVFLNP